MNETLDVGQVITFDCPGALLNSFANQGPFLLNNNATLKLRNLTVSGLAGGWPAISLTGSGTLILEHCVFEDGGSDAALDIEPTGPLNLVVTDSRISGNAAGILLDPMSGGSVNATLDHVKITGNSGGGIKIETANGPVTVDITDSVISNNAGNGINALGNAGGQAIVSIKNSVIAKNGGAGVQANGANAGVLVATTLLDQNAVGATSVVNGGNMFTYGNNQIVGPKGSGFTAPAPLQ